MGTLLPIQIFLKDLSYRQLLKVQHLVSEAYVTIRLCYEKSKREHHHALNPDNYELPCSQVWHSGLLESKLCFAFVRTLDVCPDWGQTGEKGEGGRITFHKPHSTSFSRLVRFDLEIEININYCEDEMFDGEISVDNPAYRIYGDPEVPMHIKRFMGNLVRSVARTVPQRKLHSLLRKLNNLGVDYE